MKPEYSYARLGIDVMIALLAIQFTLGIYINLYVNFPPLSSITHFSYTSLGPDFISIMIHMLLGFFLLIVSFIMLLLSTRMKNKKMILSGILAFVFVIVAGISGILFLFNELSIYSFIMSFSFIIIVISEFYYMYQLYNYNSIH